MSNLKDKLVASLRQAKAGPSGATQEPAPLVRAPQARVKPRPAVATSPGDDSGAGVQVQPLPVPPPRKPSSGFAFPERVWPD